jgi:hypothetical protein
LAVGHAVGYNSYMDTNREIDVTTLDAAHRRAFEDVIGMQLRANQRLIINVTEVNGPQTAGVSRPQQSLHDWTKVYAELDDEQIAAIDRDVKTRANLTRHLP